MPRSLQASTDRHCRPARTLGAVRLPYEFVAFQPTSSSTCYPAFRQILIRLATLLLAQLPPSPPSNPAAIGGTPVAAAGKGSRDTRARTGSSRRASTNVDGVRARLLDSGACRKGTQ